MSHTDIFPERFKTVYGKVCASCGRIGEGIGMVCKWIYRLRKVILAIPVVFVAISIAWKNAQRLPEYVGLNLQSSGEFAMTVTRGYAVFGPLLVTGFCLLLMFCTRKPLYPWIISIFSLALPYLIYFTNLYPG